MDDKDLQILNLKHNLDLLGKGLNSKDKMLKLMYTRCALLTNQEYCAICELHFNCTLICHDNSEHLNFGMDMVYEYIKHKKEVNK